MDTRAHRPPRARLRTPYTLPEFGSAPAFSTTTFRRPPERCVCCTMAEQLDELPEPLILRPTPETTIPTQRHASGTLSERLGLGGPRRW